MNPILDSFPVRDGLVGLWPFFAGTFRDVSGYDHHAVPTNCAWRRQRGLQVVDFETVGFLQVANTATLEAITAGTAFVGVAENMTRYGPAQDRWLSKRDAGGTHFDIRVSAVQLQLHDGTTTPWMTYPDRDILRSGALTFGGGVTDYGYRNGAVVDVMSAPTTITGDDAPLYIGNYYGAIAPNRNPFTVAALWNRNLTHEENAEVHAWLEEQRSPSIPADRRYFDMGSLVPVGGEEVAAWDLGDVSNLESIDRSGNSHTATLEAGAAPLPTELGRAVGLNGATAYVSVPDHADLSFGDGSDDSPFSVEAWIRMDDASGFPVISKGVYNTSGEWRLLVSAADDKLYFQCFDESVADCYIGRMYNTALTSTEGTWLHVVATYDGSEASSGLTIYVNGVPVDDADAELNAGSYVAMESLASNVHIGRDDSTYGAGAVKDARIVGRVLTAAEVLARYRERASKVMFEEDWAAALPSVANETTGGLGGTPWAIQSGTWKITESAGWKGAECIVAGQLKHPLPQADAWTTDTFEQESGTPTLTKNVADLQIDALAGEKIGLVRLTLG